MPKEFHGNRTIWLLVVKPAYIYCLVSSIRPTEWMIFQDICILCVCASVPCLRVILDQPKKGCFILFVCRIRNPLFRISPNIIEEVAAASKVWDF